MWIINRGSATNTDQLSWMGIHNRMVYGSFPDGTESIIAMERDFEKIIQAIKNNDKYVEVSI